MSADVETRQPIKLIRCPEALPDRDWMLNTVLWADGISAIWPQQDPTPRNPQEQERFVDLELLIAADGYFQPQRIHHSARDLADKLVQVPAAVLEGEPTPWSRGHAPLLGAGPEGDPGLRMSPEQARTFLYPDKMPSSVTKKLVDRGLLIEAENEYGLRGYQAASESLIPWLLGAAAEHLHEATFGDYLPAPSTVLAGRMMAEPGARAVKDLYCALEVPGLPRVSSSATMQQLLDIRANARFKEAREDYLTELRRLWDEVKRGQDAHGGPMDDPHARWAFLQDRGIALRQAQASYSRSLQRRGVLGAALTGVSAVLTLFGALNVDQMGMQQVLEGGTAGLEGVFAMTPLLARRKAPDFIRLSAPVLGGDMLGRR